MKATATGGSGQLPREFTLRSAFSLAFAFLSPIVALYSILALGLSTAGAAFWLGFPVVLVGQTFVALLFGMLASRYPQEGSIYQWSKRLVGERSAWFAAWTYQCALPIGMAAVTLGCAHFLAELLGMDTESAGTRTVLALLLLAFSTWGNTHGRLVLNAVVGLCILAEIVASLGVGALLLWRYQVNPLHVIWSTPEPVRRRRVGERVFRLQAGGIGRLVWLGPAGIRECRIDRRGSQEPGVGRAPGDHLVTVVGGRDRVVRRAVDHSRHSEPRAGRGWRRRRPCRHDVDYPPGQCRVQAHPGSVHTRFRRVDDRHAGVRIPGHLGTCPG